LLRPSAADCLKFSYLQKFAVSSRIHELPNLQENDTAFRNNLKIRNVEEVEQEGSLALKSLGKLAVNGNIQTIEQLSSRDSLPTVDKIVKHPIQDSLFKQRKRAGT